VRACQHQPSPSAAKMGHRGLAELLLEMFKTAERVFDRIPELALRLAAAFGLERLPTLSTATASRRGDDRRLLYDLCFRH